MISNYENIIFIIIVLSIFGCRKENLNKLHIDNNADKQEYASRISDPLGELLSIPSVKHITPKIDTQSLRTYERDSQYIWEFKMIENSFGLNPTKVLVIKDLFTDSISGGIFQYFYSIPGYEYRKQETYSCLLYTSPSPRD